MAGDLVSLRVLIVSGAVQDRDTLRQGAGAVSVPIDVLEAGTAKVGAGLLAAGDVDIVFIDSRIEAAERGMLLGVIRALKPPPFVFFSLLTAAKRPRSRKRRPMESSPSRLRGKEPSGCWNAAACCGCRAGCWWSTIPRLCAASCARF